MQNEFILLQNILCFLSLFNIKVEQRVFERNIKDVLYSERPILLFNDNEDKVGKIYIENGNLIIKANLGDKTLRAVGDNKKEEDLYCFNYVINKNSKDKLVGSYRVEKNKFKNGVINSNMIDIYEDNVLVLKLIFDTLRNKIKIIDNQNCVKIKYVNNNFSLVEEKTELNIVNECGYITYSLDKEYDAQKEEKKERIYGYSDITDKKNYSEIEFGFILREIYDRYFDLLKEYKSIVNNYSPYLFEKTSCMTLKTLNKEKITGILDVSFNEFKGTSYQKKK